MTVKDTSVEKNSGFWFILPVYFLICPYFLCIFVVFLQKFYSDYKYFIFCTPRRAYLDFTRSVC